MFPPSDASCWRSGSSQIGRRALVDLSSAFERFFGGLKKHGPASGFRAFDQGRRTGLGWVLRVSREERRLRLLMNCWVRLTTASAPGFEARILSAAITRRARR